MAWRVPCAATASVAANDEGRREDSRSSGGMGVPVRMEEGGDGEEEGGEAAVADDAEEAEETGTGPWIGPGAREEGGAEELLTVVVAAAPSLSARLRNLLPCSRGPRGTSISPRDLPPCVTDAAERGRHAREEVGESKRRARARAPTASLVGETRRRCRRRHVCGGGARGGGRVGAPARAARLLLLLLLLLPLQML